MRMLFLNREQEGLQKLIMGNLFGSSAVSEELPYHDYEVNYKNEDDLKKGLFHVYKLVFAEEAVTPTTAKFPAANVLLKSRVRFKIKTTFQETKNLWFGEIKLEFCPH